MFFLPKQPSCVFWRPVNHSSSSGKRGEEYMIQPSKNVGHLGAHAKEARNQPQAEAATGHPADPVQACWAGRWYHSLAHLQDSGIGEPGREASRGSWPWPWICAFPAGQVASKTSKFSTLAQLKGKKNPREAGALLESRAGAGRQGPVNWESLIFPVYHHACEGCTGQIPLTHC